MTTKDETFFESLSNTVLDLLKRSNFSDEKAKEFAARIFDDAPAELLAVHKKNIVPRIRSERKQASRFERRNYSRWQKPLDLLEALWLTCGELAEHHAHAGPQDCDPVVFNTLVHLQPRALLVTSEVMCLLRGGFADGALTRWRSLHEITVVAMFIIKHGHKAAFPYRMSVWFQGFKRANDYNKHADRAGHEPIGPDDLAEIKALRDEAESKLGRAISDDWDWAAETNIKKGRLTFADIEKDVDMEHWRPRYKWACQHTHAGFAHPTKLLGMSEAKEMVFQVGASNSGLADPIHMTAISLMQMTATFLSTSKPNFDRLMHIKMIKLLVDEIGEAAVKVQQNR